MKKSLLAIALALVLLPSFGSVWAGEPASELTLAQELEESAGWGIDLDTGKVAIDASLVYFFDSANSILVINPNLADEALGDLRALTQEDGGWIIDGQVFYPVAGELAIDSGEEPVEVFEKADLPRVNSARVSLVKEKGAGALKFRVFRKCKSCTDYPCPYNGTCSGNVLYTNLTSPARRGSCKFSFFSSCKQRWEPICNVTFFNCIGCTGGVASTSLLWQWGCFGC